MLAHEVMQRRTHSLDIAAEEIQIMGPPKIFSAAANKVLSIDVMARVILRKEGLECELSGRSIAQADAQLADLARPLWMPVHGNHRVSDLVRHRRLKRHTSDRREVCFRWGRPFDERLRIC